MVNLLDPPLPLQGGADEVVEVEGQQEQDQVPAGVGDEDKGDDPPDLAMENGAGVEAEQTRPKAAPPELNRSSRKTSTLPMTI